MKKIGMSLIIILITVITSGYLIYDYNNYKNQLKELEATYTELLPREASDSDFTMKAETAAENEVSVENEVIEEVDESQISVSEDKTIANEADGKDNQDSFDELDDLDNIENIVYEEETAAVFKINKEKITDKISLKDKAKLLKIAGKLSMMDYGNIVEIMKGYDEMGGATEIFNILKTRLSEEDYQEVKDILYPYLYVENIEDNMSKSDEK